MYLTMFREPSVNEATLSRLMHGGEFICDICEDVVREVAGEPVASWKIKGVTAIPAAVYEVTLEHSNRFGPDTLTLPNVEGFTGVRIHGGNTSAHTEGCLLPGKRNSTHTVAQSQDHLKKLHKLVSDALAAGDRVQLEIVPA
jgi:hypothetical protein